MPSQDTIKEARLVAWCQSHDWGKAAHAPGDGLIHGLRNAWTLREPDGHVSYHEETISLPADYQGLRDWAGY